MDKFLRAKIREKVMKEFEMTGTVLDEDKVNEAVEYHLTKLLENVVDQYFERYGL